MSFGAQRGKFLAHVAGELHGALNAGRPAVIVVQVDANASVDDIYALIATTMDDPSVLKVGLTIINPELDQSMPPVGEPIPWADL